jgi:hypothetical protein
LEHIHKHNVTTVPSHPSWNVIALFNANDETVWESDREQIRPRLGYNDACTRQATPLIPLPLPRLWSPDPMIEQTLPLLKEKLQSTGQQHGVMEIWDIGSGLGRDVCYLAEELLYHPPHNHMKDHCPNHTISSETDAATLPPDLPVFRIIGYDQRYRLLR